MNIELIKTEIAKLSQIVASWSDDSSISAIEKELVLSKLQNLYEIIRFGTTATAEQSGAVAATAAVVSDIINQAKAEAEAESGDESDDEPDVEVELLFEEEDEEPTEEIEAGAFMADDIEDESTEEDEVPAEEAVTENAIAAEEPTEEIETIEAIEEPAEMSEETATAKSAQEEEVASKEEPTPTEEIAPKEEVEEVSEPAPQTMGNLFGMEEPKRHTRSKHLRMMSLYDDAEPAKPKEKSVNISKIFDLSIDDVEPVSKEDIAEETMPSTTTIADANEHNVTLADTIAPNQQTLADTISRPAPLAEEITNSKISSLHDGVGINDKFLMIRDLFDGDETAYKKALEDLDAQESFDDCMIYIVENFAWNPDSEGAKFIMKLLERKHS